ncbi:MAG: HD domain-containing protein [Clostridia bacterium]|nr:HD domain-containing protein [Clostridia bacterium]
MTNRERFIEIYKSRITREGSQKLLEYLCSEKSSDFFTAPASTRFHGAYEGGLAEHSLNVYDCLVDLLPRLQARYPGKFDYSEESIAIVALLHDLCKVNFYKTEYRNVKKDGVWTSTPYFSIDDQLPYGHGEKSVYIISGYMRLSRDEAFAIRYHMGFSQQQDVPNVGKAMEMFPLAFALNCADSEASFYMEGTLPKN